MNESKTTGAPSGASPDDGAWIYGLVAELYPICRSITGNGVRETLRRIQREVPLTFHEVPTGTRVFDWEVPKEWNIRDAFIADSSGRKVVDFQKSSLHVVNYSVSVRRKLKLAELRPHLHSLPEHPDWIPYRTSYYKETWGFCLTDRVLASMADGEYEVCIDASLAPGALTYGELLLRGDTEEEILVSSHCCHPSLCNDNLSGMILAVALARHLAALPHRRYSYRFVWVPGTIGSITWLAQHESGLSRIRHGLVLSCVGDPGAFTYKRSRQGHAEIDRVVQHTLCTSGHSSSILDFSPLGYDERQYCSPGINLPVGAFMRTPNGHFPQYHTSADDLNLVTPAALGESMHQLKRILWALEKNQRFMNASPKGEPQLGRRGLYRTLGGTHSDRREDALLWMLNLSDGSHSILDVAERSGLPFEVLVTATDALVEAELLRLLPS